MTDPMVTEAADRAEAAARERMGAGASAAREGRGRLDSLDLLPEECREDLVWALGQLHARARTQADILFEFNDRLAAKGVAPVSRSAFNRRAMRLAASTRRMDEVRAQFEGLASHLTPERVDQTNLVIGEILKTLVFELAEEGAGDRTPKEAMELARAYLATIQGGKLSADQRARLEKEAAGRVMKAAEAAVAQAGEAGHVQDGPAVLKRIREQVYGITDP